MDSSGKKSFFVFLILTVFGLLLLGPKLFRPEDLFFQGIRDPNPWLLSYNWRAFFRLSIFAGEFPLWNPYSGLGEPFLANYQQAVFSPFRWIFYFLPVRMIAVPMILWELVLAGLGGWFLGRRLQLSDPAAFVCGAGYMLCGYLVQYLNNQHLPLEMLMPYGLVAMDRLGERLSWKNFLLLGLILVLILLGGQPDAALFILGFIFLYSFFRSWRLGRFWKTGAVLAAVSCFAILVCALQVLPFLEAIPQSWTYHSAGSGFQRLELKTFASILAPGIFGPANQVPVPIQRIFPWIGGVICFLALIAIFNESRLILSRFYRDRTPAHFNIPFFSLAAILGLGIAYGLPGFSLLAQLPGLNRLGWLKYLQPVISLSVIMLAGLGMEQIIKAEGKLKIFMPGMLCFLIPGSGFLYSFFSFPDLRLWSAGSFLFSGFLLLLAFLIIKSRWSKAAALAGLILVEPLVWHHLVDRPSFWINPEKAELNNFQRLAKEHPEARFSAEPEVWMPPQMLTVPLYDLGMNDALIPKRLVRLCRYLNEQRSEEELLRDFLAFHSLRLKESAFAFPVSGILSAKYFVRKSGPGPDQPGPGQGFWRAGKSGLKSFYTHTALYGDPIYLKPIPGSLGRVFFPKKFSLSRGEEESFEQILRRNNFEDEAALETGDLLPGVPQLSKPEEFKLELGRGKIILNYRSSGPALAVFSEQYFPGFRAYLDGAEKGIGTKVPRTVRSGARKKELRIYPADYLLRGVFLEPGSHQVEMIYQPYGFRIGLYSGIGSCLFLLFFIGSRVFLRARSSPGPE